MNLQLTDRVALVAGSSRGIGRAIAETFLREGARVVITGRTVDSLEATRLALTQSGATDRVLSFAGDLADDSVLVALRKRVEDFWGPIEILVANIGSGRGAVGWQLERAEWDRLFEMNFWITQRMLNKFLPPMVENGRGSVVLISSIAGTEGIRAPIPYSVAKAGLILLAKNLARELAPNGVRINAVAPGNVLFPGGTWEHHLSQRNAEVLQYIKNEVPMNRFGRPEEIADAVAFLASDRASFITGTCLIADGGQTRSI
jgi:3-oxoacyl-[acyl-carrier protein] reductase